MLLYKKLLLMTFGTTYVYTTLIPLLHFYHHWNCLLNVLLQVCHKQ